MPPPPRAPFAALLLAGGRSKRMGRDKATLEWRGQPLWQAQVEKLRALRPAELLVACRKEQGLERSFLLGQSEAWLFDPEGEDLGPMAAIVRGLQRTQLPMLVLAVDAPRVTEAFLEAQLLPFIHTQRGVFCETFHGIEPLTATYTPAMLPMLEAAIARGELSLRRAVQAAIAAGAAEVVPLLPEFEFLFTPANTPAEWQEQQRQA